MKIFESIRSLTKPFPKHQKPGKSHGNLPNTTLVLGPTALPAQGVPVTKDGGMRTQPRVVRWVRSLSKAADRVFSRRLAASHVPEALPSAVPEALPSGLPSLSELQQIALERFRGDLERQPEGSQGRLDTSSHEFTEAFAQFSRRALTGRAPHIEQQFRAFVTEPSNRRLLADAATMGYGDQTIPASAFQAQLMLVEKLVPVIAGWLAPHSFPPEVAATFAAMTELVAHGKRDGDKNPAEQAILNGFLMTVIRHDIVCGLIAAGEGLSTQEAAGLAATVSMLQRLAAALVSSPDEFRQDMENRVVANGAGANDAGTAAVRAMFMTQCTQLPKMAARRWKAALAIPGTKEPDGL